MPDHASMILSWESYGAAKEVYIHVVTHIVPGPLSLSYFIPAILLPVALMTPPERLSRRQLISIFMPVICASFMHAWIAMGGVDVCSADLAMWCLFFLGLSDPRRDFKRLRRFERCIVHKAQEPVQDGDVAKPGDRRKDGGHEDPTYESIELASARQELHPVKPSGVTTDISPTSSRISAPAELDTLVLEEPYPTPFFQRLGWVLDLIVSTRLSSWTINSPSHDSQQRAFLSSAPPSRLHFVLSLTPVILGNLLLLHPLMTQLALWDTNITSIQPQPPSAVSPNNPTGQITNLLPFSLQPRPPTAQKPYTVALLQSLLPHLILTPLTHAGYAYTCLTTAFIYPIPLVCLLNHLFRVPGVSYSPHTSPPYFGSFSTVLDRGLAGLWGEWWHQHMRVMASSPGAWAADRLPKLPRGGRARYAFITLTTFALTGVTHMGMIPAALAAANTLRLKVWLFFMAQGAGVVLEALFLDAAGLRHPPPPRDGAKSRTWIEAAARRRESSARKSARRALTLAWVLAYLCLTIPLLHRAYDDLGWWKLWPPLPPWGSPGAVERGTPAGRLKWFLAGFWIP